MIVTILIYLQLSIRIVWKVFNFEAFIKYKSNKQKFKKKVYNVGKMFFFNILTFVKIISLVT